MRDSPSMWAFSADEPARRRLGPGGIVLVALAALLPLVGIAVLLATRPSGDDGGARSLRAGTVLDADPAPAVSLTDPDGRRVSLADLRGSVVVVTFLYTRCDDICPATADLLASVDRQLGDRADDVRYVIVSVDPEGDTPEARRTFVARHRMPADRTHYLSGATAELEPVWRSYGVGRQAHDDGHDHDGAGTPSPADLAHTDVLFLIDTAGNEREVVRSDVDRSLLAADLRFLSQRVQA